jgi:hypothetical protein
MKNLAHLTQEEMVQAMDGELASNAQAELELHLANCEDCLNRFERLVQLSESLKHVVETALVSVPPQARDRLTASIEASRSEVRVRPPALWKWAAAAAGLAILMLLLVQQRPGAVREIAATKTEPPSARREPAVAAHALPSRTREARSPRHRPAKTARQIKADFFSIEGAFIRLPYSDPSLPIQASDIIHVEVPLSSLANAGVIRAAPVPGDPLVRADVLLGMDGQPSAIRLVQMGGAPR